MPKTETSARPLKAPPDAANVVTKRDALDAYGLYFEVIRYGKASGKLNEHVKVLVAEKTVSYSRRRYGTKQARWRIRSFDTHQLAREWAKTLVNSGGSVQVELRGEPVLVQLTALDVEQLRKGEAPYGRYSGQHHIDKRLGKLVDADWLAHGHVRPVAAGTPGPTGSTGTTL